MTAWLGRLLIWLALWVAGCIVCDRWLELSGPWLMSGGVMTYLLAESVDGYLKKRARAKAHARKYGRLL